MRDREHRRRPFWHLRRRPETVVAEIDEELRTHLDMRIDALEATGLSRDQARREALRQFGDLEYTRRYCRDQDHRRETHMHRTLWLEDLRQDLRICARSLLRAKLLTLTIIGTVGLGIGAATVIFSAINAALLRPLPYADPGRLVRVYTDAPPNSFRFSVADFIALQEQQTHFEAVAGYTERTMAFSDGGTPERLNGRAISWRYFSLLGTSLALGRDFTDEDDRPGAPRAVIVSNGFWRQRLGARPDAIGKPLRFDGADYTLAGVLPAVVGPLERAQDFFIAAQWDRPPRKGPFFIIVLAKLRQAGSESAATEELRAINRRIFPLWQSSYQDDRASWGMRPLQAHVVGDVTTVASLALAAVALVWLVACANASGLLVARVVGRRRELAVRAALGASRGRVIRYLLAESALLAAGAAGVGVLLASLGVGFLRAFGSGYFPRTQEIAIDGPVLWMLAALTIASACLFGIVPALHGTGGPVDDALRAAGRSFTGNVAVRRIRRVLVAGQFAIATPLLIVSGLLLVSLSQLGRVDLGFDGRNVLSGSMLLPTAQYAEPASVAAFWDTLERQARALPGVTDVAFADGRPPNDVDNFNNFELEEAPTPPGQSPPVTPWVSVTPEYFRLLGLSLIEGRLFDDRDGGTPTIEVVVVDRAWARRFFPDGRAVGKRLREGGCTSCPWTTVVGVVSEVKYAGLDKPDQGSVYWPMAGRRVRPSDATTSRSRYLIVRTATHADALIPSLHQVVRAIDPSLPLSDVATVETLVDQSLQRPRSLSLLVLSLAGVALILSIVGIYGVMAHYVKEHTKDISIRLALGGSAGDVLRLIVGQGMRVVASGVLIGLLVAFAGTRLMASLLFGVSAIDPVTFIGVAAVLLVIALIACLVPARYATALQPASVLRSE